MTDDTRPPKKTDTLEVRMPHDDKRAFLEACRREGVTASEVVRGFVATYLRRAALRERFQRQRRLAMILNTPAGRRSAAAAVAGAIGLVAVGLAPSAADADLREAFARMDLDGDGRVTLEEFAAPRHDAMLFVERAPEADGAAEVGPDATAPLDAPSWTSDDEVTFGLPLDEAAARNLAEREFATFDDDGDGAVDFAEFETRHRRIATEAFAAMDADGDGRVSADEMGDHVVAFAPKNDDTAVVEITRDHFGDLDADGDGTVSEDEFIDNLGSHH